MTDIELLPLPPYIYGRELGDNEKALTLQGAERYARAVAEHNVAELVDDRDDLLARLDASIDHGTKLGAAQQRCLDEVLEQQAEIERLRAEVGAWRELSDHVRAGACNAIWPDRYTDARTRDVAAALKRAERLAEALREARHYVDGNRFPSIVAKIDAALRDQGADSGGGEDE